MGFVEGSIETTTLQEVEELLSSTRSILRLVGTSLDSLLEDVRRFSANKPLTDDATVVVLEARE